MNDLIEVTGIVISSMPVGEYDRRIVLLTKERGKIAAFAKGARRPNSHLVAVTRTFAFGKFSLYEGRSSYNITQAQISNYFENVVTDFDAVCYACYFAEMAEYFAKENLDACEMINLLYASLKALTNERLPNELVRYIYELRLIWINGECPEFFKCKCCGNSERLTVFSMEYESVFCSECVKLNKSNIKDAVIFNNSTIYTLQFIIATPIGKLFTFVVSDEVLAQLRLVLGRIRAVTFDKKMKSEEMLPK